MAKKKSGKKGKLKLHTAEPLTIAGVAVIGLLMVGCIILSVKYTKQFFDSKNYAHTTASIVGDVDKNVIEKEDDKGNITTKIYYTYKFSFTVDGVEYYGEKNNIEDYYGENFDILYDPNDPHIFVISEESGFPWLLWVVSALLVVLEGAGIYKGFIE